MNKYIINILLIIMFLFNFGGYLTSADGNGIIEGIELIHLICMALPLILYVMMESTT
jgi:hypothetical protein